MTTVRCLKTKEGVRFLCAGHAGYAEKGRDVVCAGVSALCMALDARLQALSGGGGVRITRREASDGYFLLEAAGPVAEPLATVLAGLTSIEAQYPGFLRVKTDAGTKREEQT